MFELYRIEEESSQRIDKLNDKLDSIVELGLELKELRRLGRKRTSLIGTLCDRTSRLESYVVSLATESNFIKSRVTVLEDGFNLRSFCCFDTEKVCNFALNILESLFCVCAEIFL